MREVFGVQLDNKFYDDIIEYIQEQFHEIFKEKVIFVMKQVNVEHMGCFEIKYKYIPLHYDLAFENDRNKFVIDIFDEEGAKTTLYRIEKFNNVLSVENIRDALFKLQEVLGKNNMCFYINRNKILYKKIAGEYQRVKNLNELR